MKVVLLQNCAQGKKGDVKDVADGFARNYLIPKKIAEEVNGKVANEINQSKQASQYHYEMGLKNALLIKDKLEGLLLNKAIKFGENGKAFGCVTNKEIGEELLKLGLNIDKKKIEVAQPIKSEGMFEVKIKLYDGVDAKLKILITKEL